MIRILAMRTIKMQYTVYLCFIVLEKAFINVRYKVLCAADAYNIIMNLQKDFPLSMIKKNLWGIWEYFKIYFNLHCSSTSPTPLSFFSPPAYITLFLSLAKSLIIYQLCFTYRQNVCLTVPFLCDFLTGHIDIMSLHWKYRLMIFVCWWTISL